MARGHKREHKPSYRRCHRCEKRAGCKAMCVDVCVDEVNRIKAKKQLIREREIDFYEADRAVSIATNSDYAKLQKKKRGY